LLNGTSPSFLASADITPPTTVFRSSFLLCENGIF
jgi:hypothetical protein